MTPPTRPPSDVHSEARSVAFPPAKVGRFVVIEGIDGAGTTTQTGLLVPLP